MENGQRSNAQVHRPKREDRTLESVSSLRNAQSGSVNEIKVHRHDHRERMQFHHQRNLYRLNLPSQKILLIRDKSTIYHRQVNDRLSKRYRR
jgi:hypothetical protein